jgi:hypothetical protein
LLAAYLAGRGREGLYPRQRDALRKSVARGCGSTSVRRVLDQIFDRGSPATAVGQRTSAGAVERGKEIVIAGHVAPTHTVERIGSAARSGGDAGGDKCH